MIKKKSSLSTKYIDPLFEKIENLTKAVRIIICCVSFAILIGGFVGLNYWPKNDKIQEMEKEYAKLEKKLQTMKRKAVQYAKLKKEIEEANIKFQLALRALPEKKEIPSLLTNISNSGKTSGLDFILFKPGGEEIKEFYAEIPVNIEVSGDYHKTAMFFDKLSRLNRIVNLKNIKVSPQGSKGSIKNDLMTTCTAVTYRFIEQKDVKKKK